MLILYTATFEKLSTAQFSRYLSRLTGPEIDKIYKLKKWEDAQMSLFGKLLLEKALIMARLDPDLQRSITLGINKKPMLTNGPNFNISHSGSFVVCALSRDSKVGIDIEQIKPIPMSDFENCFCNDELTSIAASQEPLIEFYNIWTKKESIIKADGRGLHIPLTEVNTINDPVRINGVDWSVKRIEIAPGYVCHVAYESEKTISTFKQQYISFSHEG